MLLCFTFDLARRSCKLARSRLNRYHQSISAPKSRQPPRTCTLVARQRYIWLYNVYSELIIMSNDQLICMRSVASPHACAHTRRYTAAAGTRPCLINRVIQRRTSISYVLLQWNRSVFVCYIFSANPTKTAFPKSYDVLRADRANYHRIVYRGAINHTTWDFVCKRKLSNNNNKFARVIRKSRPTQHFQLVPSNITRICSTSRELPRT